MAEEFAFKQRLCNGTQVDANKILILPRLISVDGTGNQFFPRSILADDQHVGVSFVNAFNGLKYFLHRRALSDDFAESTIERLVDFVIFVLEVFDDIARFTKTHGGI